MVSQLRIYTINRGMMDSYVKLFEESIRPIHEKIGLTVECAWVNYDRTEFIWVRRFASLEEIPAKEAEYFTHPDRAALGELPQSHIAKMEVRVIEPVVASSGTG